MTTNIPGDASPCRVCAADTRHVFTLPIFNREVGYFECPNCGYLQTQTPDWLDQAYAHAINDIDTGIMSRNTLNVGRVIMTLASLGKLRGRVVDRAGGYGILVRMLRDAGVDAFWSDKYCQNLVARGFEDNGDPSDLLTAFEVFEHLVDPTAELRTMLDSAPTVLLSTELITGPETPRPDWWYLAPEHGQHIGFFRAATLEAMAKKIGCHHASDGQSVHLFSRAPIPRSWLMALRQHRRWPLVARLALKPRTDRDFEFMRQKPR